MYNIIIILYLPFYTKYNKRLYLTYNFVLKRVHLQVNTFYSFLPRDLYIVLNL